MEKKKSGGFGGILLGFLLIIGGIVLLWWNEGRTVKTSAGIKEAGSTAIELIGAKVDSQNEGKLVLASGKTTLDHLEDSEFNVSVDGLILYRGVEVFQWVESCSTDDNNNETCHYNKEWHDGLINSNDFKTSGYSNPTSVRYNSESFYASNAKLGDFSLNGEVLSHLHAKNDLRLSEEPTIEGYHLEGAYYTNTVNPNSPEIGDIRIKFSYNAANELTVLGIQKENLLTKFIAKSGYEITYAREGIASLAEVVNTLNSENKTTKWLLRGLGILLVFIGISSVLSPITNLLGKIPLLGNIANSAIGLVAFLGGLAIGLVVIAIAWFRYRPILSIGLIVAVIAIIILVKKFAANKQKSS